jgi:hypothetical protein
MKPKMTSLVRRFLKDLDVLETMPSAKKHSLLALEQYPYDHELLTRSSLYRISRMSYNKIGEFRMRVCSTMRSLSATDLFKPEIEFSPMASELSWFREHSNEVTDLERHVGAINEFNAISLFHEQNHRLLWLMLPPAPQEKRDFCRYMNFAESLIITLDLALGDQVGPEFSAPLERLKILYRPAGRDEWHRKSKKLYRQYLIGLFFATYLILELVDRRDILKVLDYVMPGQKQMNKDAVHRALELSELFTLNTNLQWQQRYWMQAQKSLAALHSKSKDQPLYLAEDPLDFEDEIVLAWELLESWGL